MKTCHARGMLSLEKLLEKRGRPQSCRCSPQSGNRSDEGMKYIFHFVVCEGDGERKGRSSSMLTHSPMAFPGGVVPGGSLGGYLNHSPFDRKTDRTLCSEGIMLVHEGRSGEFD